MSNHYFKKHRIDYANRNYVFVPLIFRKKSQNVGKLFA